MQLASINAITLANFSPNAVGGLVVVEQPVVVALAHKIAAVHAKEYCRSTSKNANQLVERVFYYSIIPETKPSQEEP